MRRVEELFSSWQLAFRPRVLIDSGSTRKPSDKRILLYYKTDAFASKSVSNRPQHTNDAEILLMVDSLSRLGFLVDLVDRSAKLSDLRKIRKFHYKAIISNCAGNSAPLHHQIAATFSYETLIAYAMGPEPSLSVKKNQQRHDNFRVRTGVEPIYRRIVRGDESDWMARFQSANAIIVNGEGFSFDSYQKYGKPTYVVSSAISKRIQAPSTPTHLKSPKVWMYFGGNGLICKGLDLVLEAFDGLADLTLHVFGPSGEIDFWNHYEPLLARNPQIFFHGFVDPASELFRRISEEAAFNIFPASSEGCATSVLTAMRLGVIPVTTWEAGVNLKDFGFQISPFSETPEEIRKTVLELAKLPPSEVASRSGKTITDSLSYSERGFQESFEHALIEVLENNRSDE